MGVGYDFPSQCLVHLSPAIANICFLQCSSFFSHWTICDDFRYRCRHKDVKEKYFRWLFGGLKVGDYELHGQTLAFFFLHPLL